MIKGRTLSAIKKTKLKSVIPSVKEYAATLMEITQHIKEAQTKAVLAVNKELIKLYWSIGKIIAERQELSGWGANVIEELVNDLQREFPGSSGFSRANIFRIRAFYRTYEKVAQPARLLEKLPIFNIPWFHNVLLLQKLESNEERLWYAQQTIENGWSRSALEAQIKSNLYRRTGKAITNFTHALPDPYSIIAQQTLKDPYALGFLGLHDDHIEQDLERGLINNVENLLLEMGKGFAFIGRQYPVEVSGKDYYIDLLFYHVHLKCYVVVELKAREFDARDIGQLNFYISAVDDMVRKPDDKLTIGLLLCKTKDNITAEYALRGIKRPIGVASYEAEIMRKLPKELKGSLPTIEELERELEKNELLSEQLVSAVKKSGKNVAPKVSKKAVVKKTGKKTPTKTSKCRVAKKSSKKVTPKTTKKCVSKKS